MIEALDIHVTGIVQGVGFRPFVYRMAKKYLINGWVLNAADGVNIHAEGESRLLDEFVIELSENAPAAAQVKEIELKEVPLQDFDSFEIRFSDDAAVQETTLVSADLATCDDCAAELFNPNDRRFRYPFINCTNCGPRFTIIDALPYDRASTSMKDFPMCERCAAEYADPLDRRFHAQPDACFECGPHLSLAWRPDCEATPGEDFPTRGAGGLLSDELPDGWRIAWGKTRETSDALIARAVELLCAGQVVAVKGLGGFHLVCDARNAEAIARLREGKRRGGKPFAVMMANAEAVRSVCEVTPEEEKALSDPARPIVLLKKRQGVALAAGLADKLPELGVMLPATPVQLLLLHDFARALEQMGVPEPPMLVMTSGNIHDEPIVTDDAEARGKLGGIACAVLGNDRAILSRYDDSVVRIISAGSAGSAVQMIRRARGFAPVPLKLVRVSANPEAAADASPDTVADSKTTTAACTEDASETAGHEAAAVAPVLFAAGSEQKSTFAFVRGSEAFVSQHVGDLENAEAFDAWLDAKSRFEKLFELRATRLACDAHPEYLASKWAREQARKLDIPLVEVQHHHAHIASVIGENGLSGAVCGIAFDGTGFGADDSIWGGEVLLANAQAYERFANFAYVPMPGGAACVKNPLRMAYGVLWEFDLLEHPAAKRVLGALGEQADLCDQMIERGLNTPMTSSVGRLFDAASAILGICEHPTYESEAAVLLEAALGLVASPDGGSTDEAGVNSRYSVAITKNTATPKSTAQDTSVLLFDAAPTFKALLDDMQAGIPAATIARRFHSAFVEAIVNAAKLAYSVYGVSTVALSGGVFMNRFIIEHALAALQDEGFTVAVNRELPPNDGCISYGQAVIACAQDEITRNE